MRKIQFQNGHYYHIYNRGVDKRDIFIDGKDYLRFLRTMRELNDLEPVESLYRQDQLRRQNDKEAKPLRLKNNRSGLASLIAYCLNSNHYHFLVEQLVNDGISKFMHKLSTGYTRYFNEKYNRSGSLFQGTFKAVEIKSDYQLYYVSAYINANSEIHKITKAENHKYSSYLDYLGKRQGTLVNKNIVLDDFQNIKDYKKYTEDIIKNSQKIKEEIKRCLIEI